MGGRFTLLVSFVGEGGRPLRLSPVPAFSSDEAGDGPWGRESALAVAAAAAPGGRWSWKATQAIEELGVRLQAERDMVIDEAMDQVVQTGWTLGGALRAGAVMAFVLTGILIVRQAWWRWGRASPPLVLTRPSYPSDEKGDRPLADQTAMQ